MKYNFLQMIVVVHRCAMKHFNKQTSEVTYNDIYGFVSKIVAIQTIKSHVELDYQFEDQIPFDRIHLIIWIKFILAKAHAIL